jgi:hypothetical protein
MQAGSDKSQTKYADDASAQPPPHTLEQANEDEHNKTDLQWPKDHQFKMASLVCH